jgi:phasin family protein
MITKPENLVSANKDAIESVLTTIKTTFDSSERLAALNLNTTRSLVEQTTANVKAMLTVSTPDDLLKLQAAMVKPMAEKALAYYRNCYEIVAQGIEEAVKPFEVRAAEMNKAFAIELEKAAAASPVGSEAALAAVKTSIAAANSTYDQVSKASRQAVEIAEANMAAATDAAVKAVTSVPTTPATTGSTSRAKKSA